MMNNDPFASIQTATREHREAHGCGAYTFEDGPGLARISADAKPARILELGTALGYTSCCLASGSPTTTVDTIEGDPDHARLAQEQIEAAGLADRITVHNGDFAEVLPRLTGTFDLIFFDGFAPSDMLLTQLRSILNPGGTLVCANIGLTHGQQQANILAELANTDRWSAVDTIEQQQTMVVRKVEVGG